MSCDQCQARRHYLHERRRYRPDGDSFLVTVRVLEKRNSYGTDHYLIEPVDGTGQRWTTGSRLSPVEAAAPRGAYAGDINPDTLAALGLIANDE